MDAKSLARSKRAHTLHHSKKSHSNPKSKPSGGRSSGAGSSTKTPEKPISQRPRSSLPSNWDRYGEELDEGVGELSEDGSRQLSELPLPKSKGADYRHLIDEAKSQPHTVSDSFLDMFPTMDDVFPDYFNTGLGSLLSSQGEGILQSMNYESFTIDDKEVASHEVPLLSLNLNALAEQLAKIDLAKRLFIEEDLLPPGLHEDGTSASSKNETVQVQVDKAKAVAKQMTDFDFDDFIKETKKDDTHGDTGANSLNLSGNQVAHDMGQTRLSSQSIALQAREQSVAYSVPETESKSSTFKAATAEAELDALLDSFTETKLTDTTGPGGSTLLITRPSLDFSVASPAPNSAKVDVLLDDLLEETSQMAKPNGLQSVKVSSASNQVKSSASKTQSTSKSKVLDDFDSWLDTI